MKQWTRSIKTYVCSACKQRNVIVEDLFVIVWCPSIFSPSIIHVPAQHTLRNLLLLILSVRVMKIAGIIITDTIILSITTNSRTSCMKWKCKKSFPENPELKFKILLITTQNVLSLVFSKNMKRNLKTSV